MKKPDEAISAPGWRMIAAGACCVLAGFFALRGASGLASFLILGGYGLVCLGIFLPAKPEKTVSPSDQR